MNQIIHTIFMLLVFTGISMGGYAQEITSANKDFPVNILNRRSRPVKNVLVVSQNTGNAGLTDRSGRFVFNNLSVDDIISVELPNYGAVMIPVADLDSVVVTLQTRKRLSYIDNFGQSVSIERGSAETSSVLDVQKILKTTTYSSLSELLRGRVSGLFIVNAPSRSDENAVSTKIRGVTSFNNNEPLVVLNGVPFGTLTEANITIDVYDVKTIEVKKDGLGWGSRGANGVILIHTK